VLLWLASGKFPEEDRAGGSGSPGRVGHVGRDNARSAAMSVSLLRCTVAVTYPGGAFLGCVLVAVTPHHPSTRSSKALEKGLPHSSVGAQFRAPRRGIDLHSPAHLLGRVLREFFALPLSLTHSLPLCSRIPFSATRSAFVFLPFFIAYVVYSSNSLRACRFQCSSSTNVIYSYFWWNQHLLSFIAAFYFALNFLHFLLLPTYTERTVLLRYLKILLDTDLKIILINY